MKDDVLGYLREAKSLLYEQKIQSRENSITITKIDEAILWRKEYLRLASPTEDTEKPIRNN